MQRYAAYVVACGERCLNGEWNVQRMIIHTFCCYSNATARQEIAKTGLSRHFVIRIRTMFVNNARERATCVAIWIYLALVRLHNHMIRLVFVFRITAFDAFLCTSSRWHFFWPIDACCVDWRCRWRSIQSRICDMSVDCVSLNFCINERTFYTRSCSDVYSIWVSDQTTLCCVQEEKTDKGRNGRNRQNSSNCSVNWNRLQ